MLQFMGNCPFAENGLQQPDAKCHLNCARWQCMGSLKRDAHLRDGIRYGVRLKCKW
jgi:hypothetical protein